MGRSLTGERTKEWHSGRTNTVLGPECWSGSQLWSRSLLDLRFLNSRVTGARVVICKQLPGYSLALARAASVEFILRIWALVKISRIALKILENDWARRL